MTDAKPAPILPSAPPAERALSLLLCSRNDRYQGDSIWRLETALNHLGRAVAELGREDEVEAVLVDWGSEVPLRDVLKLDPAAAHITSTLHVPRELCVQVQGDSPFPEVLALNAAARRARGAYLGRIDQDTLVGRQFLEIFFDLYEGRRSLGVPLSSALMLSNRRRIPYRFAVRCPEFWAVEQFLRWFHRVLPLMDPLPPELYYQSFVGLWMIHRDRWWEIGGYDERFIHMDWQEVDMILRLDAEHTFVNLGEVVDHDFYHLDHAHPRGAWEAARNRKTNPVRNYDQRPPETRPNDESWGLARHPLSCLPCETPAALLPMASEPSSAADWPRFLALTGATGAQIAWDHSLLALASLRRRLRVSAALWEVRIGLARDRVRGQPPTRWPVLLASLFLEKVRSRVR